MLLFLPQCKQIGLFRVSDTQIPATEMGDIASLKFNSIMIEDYETLALLLILKLSTRSTETPAPASAIGPAACSVTGCRNEISHAAGFTKSPSVTSSA